MHTWDEESDGWVCVCVLWVGDQESDWLNFIVICQKVSNANPVLQIDSDGDCDKQILFLVNNNK